MSAKRETQGMDVRRIALPRQLPVFLKKDLAYRYCVDAAIITRWLRDGVFPPEDVFDAEGKTLGWTFTTIAQNEAANADLTARFRKNEVVATMPVSDA